MKELSNRLHTIIESAYSVINEVTEEESSLLVPGMKWTPKGLLGHLIDSAANNHQRFIRAQSSSQIRLPGYAQEEYVRHLLHHLQQMWIRFTP